MKKFLSMFAACMFCTTNAFADVSIENPNSEYIYIYNGKIRAGVYVPSESKIRINIQGDESHDTKELFMVFTGKDLQVGAGLLNALGTSIIISFFDGYSRKIKHFVTYDVSKSDKEILEHILK